MTEIKLKDGLTVYDVRDPSSIVNFNDLPTWVRIAAAMHDLMGMTWKEAAKRCGKKEAGSISHWNKSPAFQEWREEVRGVSLDPRQVVERIISASIAGVALDYHAAYEKAVEVGDYKEVAKMSQDLLDRFGIVRKKDEGKKEAIKLEISLGNAGTVSLLEPPRIESTYDTIQEATFEVVSNESNRT